MLAGRSTAHSPTAAAALPSGVAAAREPYASTASPWGSYHHRRPSQQLWRGYADAAPPQSGGTAQLQQPEQQAGKGDEPQPLSRDVHYVGPLAKQHKLLKVLRCVMCAAGVCM